MESLRELELSAPEKKIKKEIIKEEVVVSFEDRKEINRMISRFEKLIIEAEYQISKLEEEIATMDKVLADSSTTDVVPLYERYGVSKKRVETEMKEWESLHEELKSWEAKRTW